MRQIVISLKVPAELKAKLQKQAKKRKISVSELIKTAISNEL
jgi:post-segregation antitoxin (ccd killing protein)